MNGDPGYGDPTAPVGSAEWAKRWRLCFQTAVKKLPTAPAANLEFYQIGVRHRAWTLLTDEQGEAFPDFDAFCRCEQPWGLEIDPAKFRAHLAAELGEKAADLITAAPSGQGKRTDIACETSSDHRTKSRRLYPSSSLALTALP